MIKFDWYFSDGWGLNHQLISGCFFWILIHPLGDFFWMFGWFVEVTRSKNLLQWFPLFFLNSMHLVAITWAGLVSFRLMVQKSGVHQLRLLVYPCLSMFIPVFSKFYTSKRWFSRAGFLNHQQYQVPFLPLKHTKMLPMQTCKPLWRLVEAGDFVEFPTKKLHHCGTSRFFPPATPVESKPTSEKIIGIPTTFCGHLRWIIMQILMVFHKSHCQRWVTKSTKNPEVFHSTFRLPLKNGWERKEHWSGFHFSGLEVPFQGVFAVLNFGRVSNFFSCFFGGAARLWIF